MNAFPRVDATKEGRRETRLRSYVGNETDRITVATLSKQSGVQTRTIQRCVNKQQPIRLKAAKKLVEALGELLGRPQSFNYFFSNRGQDFLLDSREGAVAGNYRLFVPNPKVVSDQLFRTLTQDWAERCLYVGDEGARTWIDVGEEQLNRHEVRAALARLASRANVDTLVSLGPGDGRLDKEMANAMSKGFATPMNYVACDINVYLLASAMGLLANENNVKVPFAAVADFEHDFGKLAMSLRSCSGLGGILFSCVGYTLGNLTWDRDFLLNILREMATGDCLLFDYLPYGDTFAFEKYQSESLKEYKGNLAKWLSLGASLLSGDALDDIQGEFNSRFRFVDAGRAAFDFCKNIRIEYRNPQKQRTSVLTFMRWYNSKRFSNWLNNKMACGCSLEVVEIVEAPGGEFEYSGTGMMLVRKLAK
jgi:hypothetical protein